MKKLLSLILILAAASLALGGNVTVTNPPKQPVPVTSVSTVGGTALTTTTAYSTHVTTNTTIAVVVTIGTVYVNTVQVTVSGAGSAWTITIQSKEATPKRLYSATAAVGSFTPVSVQIPIGVMGGIDIITAGTTPGTADIWITYSQ